MHLTKACKSYINLNFLLYLYEYYIMLYSIIAECLTINCFIIHWFKKKKINATVPVYQHWKWITVQPAGIFILYDFFANTKHCFFTLMLLKTTVLLWQQPVTNITFYVNIQPVNSDCCRLSGPLKTVVKMWMSHEKSSCT